LKEILKMGLGEDGGLGPKLPEWSGAEATIEEMNALGVDVQVLSLSAPGVCFQDEELSKALAQMANDILSDISNTYPHRFRTVASVPLNNLSYALEELHRAINDLTMDGVALGTNINQRYLSNDEFLPFFEELDKMKVPIILHPMMPIGDHALPAEDRALAISPAVGFLFETTRTMAQMTFKGIFERFKNLTFVLPHAGGAIPFVYPRWDTVYLSRPDSHPMKKVPHPPSYYLKRHYYDITASYYPSSLRCTIDLAGSDHVLFGTDYPYSRDGRAKKTIDYLEDYGFSKEEKEKLFFGNALGLFPKIEG
jgi:predicted TIM-barrel fold metal-dependent hydrolase